MLEKTGRQSLQDLISNSPQEKADGQLPYLQAEGVDEDIVTWQASIQPLLRWVAEEGLVPTSGLVVEFGSYQGASLKVLSEMFGAERTLGFDVYAYTQNPQILIGDIRHMKLPEEPAALAWNDLSTWRTSPRSKLAAFHWAQRNLVSGGIYIDGSRELIPLDLDMADFDLVYQDRDTTIFRKK